MFSRWKNLFIVLVLAAILMAGVSFALQIKTHQEVIVSSSQNNVLTAPVSVVPAPPPPPPQKLSNPPEVIKAVYVTGYSASSKKYLNYLSDLFRNTEINAVVIDIKGSDGRVFRPNDDLVRFLHDQNIYLIGRIAVFEDPVYSRSRPELAVYDTEKTIDLAKPFLWQDNNGLSWLDPASKDAWEYNISLAKDVFYHGFDEVNFDYIRFPSDGKASNMGFPIWDGKTSKAEVIKEFFSYLRTSLAGEKISVDLFGQTTTDKNDMGIGQLIENAFETFDYISPMVYPSHYITGFMGFVNPAEHPYEIVKYSMSTAQNREDVYLKGLQSGTPTAGFQSLAKFRPWLQDFNMGAFYNAEMVKAEIQATQDALGENYKGFMLWNPSNIYTQGALTF